MNIFKKVNKSQQSLEALNQAMPMIEFDLNGKILNANQNSPTLFGYKCAELAGAEHDHLSNQACL